MNNEEKQLVLECEHIKKSFAEGKLHVDVLNDVSLRIFLGEMLAVIGPSGSGKSTLLHVLGGLDKPNFGSVKICGYDLTKLSEQEKCKIRNRYLGFVYQFHHLLPEFTALENVCMPLFIRGLSPAQAIKIGRDILNKVGLSKREEHRTSELSGGERQRVAIARALITRPKCVLADEPTGNLDMKTAEQIYELISSLNKEFNTAFVIVTHDLSIAKRMQRILKIEDGCLSQY